MRKKRRAVESRKYEAASVRSTRWNTTLRYTQNSDTGRFLASTFFPFFSLRLLICLALVDKNDRGPKLNKYPEEKAKPWAKAICT